jgi:hypothetical protein
MLPPSAPHGVRAKGALSNPASEPGEIALRSPPRLTAHHASKGASREVGQKACYGGGTLAAGERGPTDGAAQFERSQWG